MKRIAIDMDEVLADTLAEHIARYNRDHDEAVTKADLAGKWLWEIVSADRQERLEGYLRSEDFFEDLEVMADSQRVVKALKLDEIPKMQEKWKAKTHNARQLILNLNQQIINLQNNPLLNPLLANMTTIFQVMDVVTPLIAPVPQYIGQEPPEDYINKIIQLYNCGTTISACAGFNNTVKTQILATKMGKKYISSNPFNN